MHVVWSCRIDDNINNKASFLTYDKSILPFERILQIYNIKSFEHQNLHNYKLGLYTFMVMG